MKRALAALAICTSLYTATPAHALMWDLCNDPWYHGSGWDIIGLLIWGRPGYC